MAMAMGKMIRLQVQPFRRICSSEPILPRSGFYTRRRLFCSEASPDLPPKTEAGGEALKALKANLKANQGSQTPMLQNEIEKVQHEIEGIRNDIAKVVKKLQLDLTRERRLYIRTVAQENAKRDTVAKLAQFTSFLIPLGILGGGIYKMSSKK